MKKIIACISLVFAMSAGVTALADEVTYSADDNSASIDASGYTTVLIQKDNETLFVDQNDAGLNGTNSTAKFLLKGEAGTKLDEGEYTVKLGGSSTGETKETSFTISYAEPAVTALMEMKNKVINVDGTYNAGYFGTFVADACKYVSITNKANNLTACVSLASASTAATGEGEMHVAVMINNIPEEVTLDVSLTDTDSAAE